jgi:hypothetical protein
MKVAQITLEQNNHADFVYALAVAVAPGGFANAMYRSIRTENGLISLRISDHQPNWMRVVDQIESVDDMVAFISITVGDDVCEGDPDLRGAGYYRHEAFADYGDKIVEIAITDGMTLEGAVELIRQAI